MKKQKWAVFFLMAGRLAASSSFSFVQMIAGNGQDRVSAVAAGPDGSLYIAGHYHLYQFCDDHRNDGSIRRAGQRKRRAGVFSAV
jgi:hypothetical protein